MKIKVVRWQNDKKKLKPCPFCGSTWLYITTEHGWLDDSTVIFCNSCKASVKLEENDQEGMTEETKRKAVEAWNKRVQESE